MPSPAYSTLTALIHDHDTLDLLDILHSASDDKSPSFASANKADMQKIARDIHLCCVASSSLVPLLMEGLKGEINKVPAGHTSLFRDGTSVTRAMDFAMRWYGKAWLDESLGMVIQRIVAEKVHVETDMAHIEKSLRRDGSGGHIDASSLAKELESNVKTLVYWCEQVWTSVVNARGQCPKCVASYAVYTLITDIAVTSHCPLQRTPPTLPANSDLG